MGEMATPVIWESVPASATPGAAGAADLAAFAGWLAAHTTELNKARQRTKAMIGVVRFMRDSLGGRPNDGKRGNAPSDPSREAALGYP